MGKKLTHINRTLTRAQRRQADGIRAAAKRDFPPKTSGGQDVSPPGIPARIRSARNGRSLTCYAVGQLAGVPSVAVRDIERGADVSLSQLQAVASVLGLTIELVDQAS
jgi:Helix-turn-helix domain